MNEEIKNLVLEINCIINNLGLDLNGLKYTSLGAYEELSFQGKVIWNTEDESRGLDEITNDYESWDTLLKRKIQELKNDLDKLLDSIFLTY